MLKQIKSILFATNLLPTSRAAFDMAILLAFQHQAKLLLLNVHEQKAPKYIEDMVQDYIGKGEWGNLTDKILKNRRDKLIGKISAEKLTRAALEHLCEKAEAINDNCGTLNYEIFVEKGDVVNSTLNLAEKSGCDIIVMGAREGLFENNSIGSKVKGVMRKSKVPVVFVPTIQEKENTDL